MLVKYRARGETTCGDRIDGLGGASMVVVSVNSYVINSTSFFAVISHIWSQARVTRDLTMVAA